MNKANIFYLAEDVTSTVKRGYKYGEKGDEVREISRSWGVNGEVLAVTGKKESFPVLMNKLILKTK